MLWKELEKQVRNSIYSDYFYWNVYVFPYTIKNSIYQKYYKTSYVKFEHIPENWTPVRYFLFFNKMKDYYYPVSDDIKFFNFNLFKKNGFLFLLFCGLVFQNCFIEFLLLLLKSLFTFYVILDFIYIIFLIRKYVRFFIRLYYYLSFNLFYIFLLISVNNILNMYLKSQNKWYF